MRHAIVSQHVLVCRIHHIGEFRRLGVELVGDAAPLGMGRGGIGVGSADSGRDDAALGRPCVCDGGAALGRGARRRMALHCAGQAAAECVRGELQRPSAGRMPERARVRLADRSASTNRGLARGLQSGPAPRQPWRPDAGGVCEIQRPREGAGRGRCATRGLRALGPIHHGPDQGQTKYGSKLSAAGKRGARQGPQRPLGSPLGVLESGAIRASP